VVFEIGPGVGTAATGLARGGGGRSGQAFFGN